jgi:6-phosphofructokinase 1
VVAEGLAEFLSDRALQGIPRDDHGHISISDINLNRIFAKQLADAYQRRTGKSRKVNGLQLGYESRCAPPTAFDVMLGSQIGVGAYRALVEKQLNGVMISIHGQFEIRFVPFAELVDPKTLVTKVRFIDSRSDFYRMARLLETKVQGSHDEA